MQARLHVELIKSQSLFLFNANKKGAKKMSVPTDPWMNAIRSTNR